MKYLSILFLLTVATSICNAQTNLEDLVFKPTAAECQAEEAETNTFLEGMDSNTVEDFLSSKEEAYARFKRDLDSGEEMTDSFLPNLMAQGLSHKEAVLAWIQRERSSNCHQQNYLEE